MSLSKMPSDTTDIIVVGSGAAGLTTACELLRRGISCRFIAQNTTTTMMPKITELHSRTLELLEQLDIAEEILSCGQPLYDVIIYSNGRHLAQIPLEIRDEHTRFQYMLMLKSYKLEQILQKRFTALKGHIEYGMRLQSISQDNHGVTLRLVDPEGQEQRMHASWLVACDGDQGIVHQQSNLPLTGFSTTPWLVADVKFHWKRSEDLQNTLHIFLLPESSLLAYPIEDCWRIIDSNPDPVGTATGQEVTEHLTRKIQATMGSTDIVAHSPGAVALFTLQQHKSSTFRSHRCFIIGNVTRNFGPIDSQEMNTGIQDAFNLAWKLALVCKGAASDSLLDSYPAERGATGEETLYTHDFITQMPYRQVPAMYYLRDTMLTAIMHTMLFRETLLRKITSAFSELAIAYYHSMLNAQDWPYASDETASMNGLEPGTRLPDVQLGDLNGAHLHYLLHILQEKWYSLLIFTGRECSAEELHILETFASHVQARYGEYIAIYFVSSSLALQRQLQWKGPILLDVRAPVCTLHQHFGAHQPSLYLIRPDRYISYRSQPANEKAFFTYMDQCMNRLHSMYPTDEQKEAAVVEREEQPSTLPSKEAAIVEKEEQPSDLPSEGPIPGTQKQNEKVPALVASTSVEKFHNRNKTRFASTNVPFSSLGIPKDAM